MTELEQKSQGLLNKFIKARVNKIMRSVLECIELEFGKDFENFDLIRSRILRDGNDAIRSIKNYLENFTVVHDGMDLMTIYNLEGKDEEGKGI